MAASSGTEAEQRRRVAAEQRRRLVPRERRPLHATNLEPRLELRVCARVEDASGPEPADDALEEVLAVHAGCLEHEVLRALERKLGIRLAEAGDVELDAVRRYERHVGEPAGERRHLQRLRDEGVAGG